MYLSGHLRWDKLERFLKNKKEKVPSEQKKKLAHSIGVVGSIPLSGMKKFPLLSGPRASIIA
jgi:hypothetical protein